MGQFFDLVLVSPFLEEFFFRFLFMIVLFLIFFPFLYFLFYRSKDSHSFITLEFQRMISGSDYNRSYAFKPVLILLLFFNASWALGHIDYGPDYPYVVFFNGLIYIFAYLNYGLLCSMLFHAEWNFFALIFSNVQIADPTLNILIFFIVNFLIFLWYLATFLVLEALMNKGVYSKLNKTIILLIYLCSLLVIIFDTYFVSIFSMIGSFEYEALFSFAPLFLFISFLHLIYFLLHFYLTETSNNNNNTILRFCVNCGKGQVKGDFCGSCGHKFD
ncbi:MAG: type II CAAX prenyl endopeptidase Rce1 family protein [Candidatus Thorarchaeota archaeon]